MSRLRTLRAMLIAGMWLLPAGSAHPDKCVGPPWNAWPSGAPQQVCSGNAQPCASDLDCPDGQTCRLRGTLDQDYLSGACSSFLNAWNALHMDVSDWDEGHGLFDTGNGYTATCDINDDLTRALTGWRVVEIVTAHAIPFGLHRWIQDPDDDLTVFDRGPDGRLTGNWTIFVATHEPDEWVPGCGNSGVLATNHTGIDDFIELHKLSMYRNTAVDRSSTIVHETAHEDVGHEDDNSCAAGGSCDLQFGRYNAQTVQIHYLYDAATTYQTQMLNGKLVHVGVPFDPPGNATRKCRAIPRFSEYERNLALSKANGKYDNNFAFGPVIPLIRYDDAEFADIFHRKVWECDQCDPSEWNFDPNQCEQIACNELLNPANAQVNAANAGACLLYNVDVSAGGFTQEAIDQAKADHPLQGCLIPTAAGARAYCEAEKASAPNLAELDSCGWLEGLYFPDVSAKLCMQEYCHERFEADQGVGWSPSGDPYGCLDHFCPPDEEKCSNDLPQAQCRQLFLAAHGHPDYYLAPCTSHGCKGWRASCILNLLAEDPNAWEYPQPAPPLCQALYSICKKTEELLAGAFLSIIDIAGVKIPSTGPVEKTINPAIFVPNLANEFQTKMLSGAGPDELGPLWQLMMSEPEMLRGLFELDPGRFVALFGNEGFEELIGPQVRRVAPVPLVPADLHPPGQQALAELEELIATTPPDEFVSPFGTVRSQRMQVDTDEDGVPDFQDNCPNAFNPPAIDAATGAQGTQADADGDGRGDACECGDASGDGHVNTTDARLIQRFAVGQLSKQALRCAEHP